jgi:hypothetical protein
MRENDASYLSLEVRMQPSIKAFHPENCLHEGHRIPR